MLPHQLALRLQAKIDAIDHAVVEAADAASALDQAAPEAAFWLPGIRRSIERVQLECADLRFAIHQLREALPSNDILQPRLL